METRTIPEIAREIATATVTHSDDDHTRAELIGTACAGLDVYDMIGVATRLALMLQFVYGTWADVDGRPHKVPSWSELMTHIAAVEPRGSE